ncbi:AI-2E family transporter [uncultured Azohydromonas sp.]|uniref:AI-2E family transporter n=1 Tax=uncultured Azohydromonas sp. TaxID=487342 RepID=UPI002633F82C|nr:AI-2E family transporter [uncultured Azohydromonas sp.]
MSERPPSLRDFTLRVLVLLALVVLALFLWRVLDVLLLGFASVLAAILLRALAEPIARRLGVPDGVALGLAVLLVLALLGAVLWLFGAEVASQATQLIDQLPRAWEALRQVIERSQLGAMLLAGMKEAGPNLGPLLTQLSHATAATSGALVGLLLVAFGGVYLAGNPGLYRRGLLKLFPRAARTQVDAVIDSSGQALRLWLVGQLAVMVAVGLLTGLGLWLIGMPAPLALGLLAGLAEFVPYVGPIAAALPGLLLALTLGPELGLYALAVYVVVQQLESNVITPLVARRMLELPPALVLFSVVALGLVLGPLGLVLAAPLTVVLAVAVAQLYVRETLDTPVQVPGQDAAQPRAD